MLCGIRQISAPGKLAGIGYSIDSGHTLGKKGYVPQNSVSLSL